jgi:hypothetical protein
MANFIVCAYHEDELIIKIPTQSRVITKAINTYQKYNQAMHEKLIARASTIAHDHKAAERIALELLRENGYSGVFELL